VIRYAPLAAGVPDRIPVAALSVTPFGSVPLALNVGAGEPVAVTVNVPAVPTAKVALFALVIAGGEFTVSVKLWLAFGASPFCAVNVIRYVPLTVGVPDKIPVSGLKVTPFGSVPLSLRAGAGVPVVVTVNDPAVPTVNFVVFALVIAGGEFTVSVKL
jgi:hypothetical protein